MKVVGTWQYGGFTFLIKRYWKGDDKQEDGNQFLPDSLIVKEVLGNLYPVRRL